MIMPPITDICVNYCTDNCTFECRPMSGNNPFRIPNIVNGTNYTISLSLRNDFGQSGQTTPKLYGECEAVSVVDIHMTVYILCMFMTFILSDCDTMLH